MTNLEWFKKRINEMSAEEINRLWYEHKEPWCSDDRCNYGSCSDCMMEWINQPYKEPMPELKVGMFVKADNKFMTDLGIVINNIYADDLAVAYKSGGFDPLNAVKIKAVYSTVSFRCCDEDTCIWRRD